MNRSEIARMTQLALSNNYSGSDDFDDLDALIGQEGEGFEDFDEFDNLDGEGYDDLDGDGYDDLDGEGYDDLDGEGYDDYVGVKSMASRIETTDIKIDNKTGSQKLIVLFPGAINVDRPVVVYDNEDKTARLIDLIGGQAIEVVSSTVDHIRQDNPNNFSWLRSGVDAVVTDGKIFGDPDDETKYIEVTSPKGIPVAVLHDFVKNNPCKIRKIQITSNDREMFSSGLLIFMPTSAFNRTGDKQLSLNQFVNPNQLNERKVVIDFEKEGLNYSLDDQTVVMLQMPGDANGSPYLNAVIQFELYVSNTATDTYGAKFKKKKGNPVKITARKALCASRKSSAPARRSGQAYPARRTAQVSPRKLVAAVKAVRAARRPLASAKQKAVGAKAAWFLRSKLKKRPAKRK